MTINAPDAAIASGTAPAEEVTAFGAHLIGAGVLHTTGVPGVYGRSARFEEIAGAVHRAVTALAAGKFEAIEFPPIVARPVLQRSGYFRSFTDLIGSVHVFRGSLTDHLELVRRLDENGDWTQLLAPADVMLASAACHPVYPMCTGRLPPGGRRIEVRGQCFRHEPSSSITRLQSFRMHELVVVGTPDAARAHRDTGLTQGVGMLSDLGLAMSTAPANDPFFGRGAALLADGQRQDAAKYEGIAPVGPDGQPTAIMSANYAADHFGTAFSIVADSGAVAHSSCVAFGIDRITLALLSAHGLLVDRWPRRVRARLWP